MSEGEGPLFRANKRRKVFRKRPEAYDEPGELENGTPTRDVDEEEQPAVPLRRPVAASKRGIAFSSNGTSARDVSRDAEKQLVPSSTEATVAQPGSGRFVKPTGQLVVEDRHMTAYIGSKLNDAASSTTKTVDEEASRSNDDDDNNTQPETTNGPPASHPTKVQPRSGQEHAAIGSIEEVSVEALRKRRQQRATLPIAPTSRNPRQQQQQQRRRRRANEPPSPSAHERSSMVDQIMAESLVPLYDKGPASSNASALQQAGTGEGETDDAVAEAFKRKFLADVEERSLRARVPTMPSSSAVGAGQQKTGPKLGGSRQQRGRMMKEAKEGQQGGGKGK